MHVRHYAVMKGVLNLLGAKLVVVIIYKKRWRMPSRNRMGVDNVMSLAGS